MGKTKNKQEHMSRDEVKISLAEQKEQVTDKECTLEIEEVLKKHSRALQCYLGGGELAIIPRVRLIRVKPEEEKDSAEKEDGKEDE